jgi:hypothetical protein
MRSFDEGRFRNAVGDPQEVRLLFLSEMNVRAMITSLVFSFPELQGRYVFKQASYRFAEIIHGF